jgi:CRP/FNR family transcriptional regulator
MEDLLDCLIQVPVFAKLDPADQHELARAALKRRYREGEFVCWQGEPWPKAALVFSGVLDWAMLSPQGKRQIVFRLGPCDLIWGHTMLDDKPMPASVEVKQEATLYEWLREDIEPVISRSVEAVWEVSRLMVGYMRHARDLIYGFAFQAVAGRLARLLLEHYQPVVGQPTPRELSLDEMAERIGTNPEFVSRTLHQFSDQGMLKISRMEFVLTDLERLTQVAGQDQG